MRITIRIINLSTIPSSCAGLPISQTTSPITAAAVMNRAEKGN